MKPARNSASSIWSGVIRPCSVGERIGAGGIAVVQQAAGQQVALGPEPGELIRRRIVLRGLAGALPQSERVRGAVGIGAASGRDPASWPGSCRSGSGRAATSASAFGRVVLQGQPRLGRGAMRRVEARDLSRGRRGVVPGEVLEALPLVVRLHGAGPAAQEAGLVGRCRRPRRGAPPPAPRRCGRHSPAPRRSAASSAAGSARCDRTAPAWRRGPDRRRSPPAAGAPAAPGSASRGSAP